MAIKNIENSKSKSQSGQTLVEFVLLLASIVILSISIIRIINGEVSLRWQGLAIFIAQPAPANPAKIPPQAQVRYR